MYVNEAITFLIFSFYTFNLIPQQRSRGGCSDVHELFSGVRATRNEKHKIQQTRVHRNTESDTEKETTYTDAQILVNISASSSNHLLYIDDCVIVSVLFAFGLRLRCKIIC